MFLGGLHFTHTSTSCQCIKLFTCFTIRIFLCSPVANVVVLSTEPIALVRILNLKAKYYVYAMSHSYLQYLRMCVHMFVVVQTNKLLSAQMCRFYLARVAVIMASRWVTSCLCIVSIHIYIYMYICETWTTLIMFTEIHEVFHNLVILHKLTIRSYQKSKMVNMKIIIILIIVI